MKHLLSLMIAVFIISISAWEIEAGEKSIAVYYFHGWMRCSTCYKMEQYTKEAIETNFKKEIASGKLVFKVINYEEKGNEHYVDKYQLYTKAVIVAQVQDNKEIKYKNLPKIWDYVGDKNKFFNYIINEVKEYLKE